MYKLQAQTFRSAKLHARAAVHDEASKIRNKAVRPQKTKNDPEEMLRKGFKRGEHQEWKMVAAPSQRLWLSAVSDLLPFSGQLLRKQRLRPKPAGWVAIWVLQNFFWKTNPSSC